MKRSVILMAVVAAGLGACSDDDDETGPQAEVYVATLSGANERPNPVNSSGSGSFKLTVNPNRTLTYDLSTSGFTPTNQHIHGPADANTSAGVIVGLTLGLGQVLNATSSFTGAVSYDSLLVLLRNGRAYVNVHSATNPGGEVRGQLMRQ